MRSRLSILLALAGGAVLALAFPLVIPQLSLHEIDPAGHLGWLAFVGLVPVLMAVSGAGTWKRAFGLGTLAGLAFSYLAIYWVNFAMTAFGGLPFGLAFIALSLLALYMAVHWGGALAVSWVIRRWLGWPWWSHLPLVWVAFELVRDHLFTGFPWANLGYSQARHTTLAQVASLFGVYGVAALVVLVNCVLHEIAAARLERRAFPTRLAAGALAVLAAALVYGRVHLAEVRRHMSAAAKLRVALIQPNVDQSVKNAHELNGQFIMSRIVPLTLQADQAGADLVAWPEAAFPYFVSPSTPEFKARADFPALRHAHLLVGASTLEWTGLKPKRVPRVTNSVFLLRPDLTVLARYDKHHAVPFGEYVPLADWFPFLGQLVPDLAPTSPGRDLVVLRFPVDGPVPAAEGDPAGAASLAPMICYDAIFPEINIAFARNDPEILVNPTNDAWYGYSSGPYQFLDIVRVRAIEAGKAVARPAYSGVSAFILPTGELAPGVLDLGPVDPERAPNANDPARLLLGEVPRLQGRTLYTSIGDLFAYASAAYAIGALGMALAKRRKPDADKNQDGRMEGHGSTDR